MVLYMKKCLVAAAVLVGIFISTPAVAMTRIYLSADDNGKTSRLLVVISNHRIRLNDLTRSGREFLFLAKQQQLILIDHSRREFVQLGQAEVEQIGEQITGLTDQLQAQLEGLTAEKRSQVIAMLDSLGLADLAEPPMVPGRIIMTGQHAASAGIACQWVRIMHGESATAELCLAEQSAINLPESDYAAVQQLLTFTQTLGQTAGPLLSKLGVSIPAVETSRIKGLPMIFRDHKRNLSVSVQAVDQIDVALRLKLPSGYTRAALPRLGL